MFLLLFNEIEDNLIFCGYNSRRYNVRLLYPADTAGLLLEICVLLVMKAGFAFLFFIVNSVFATCIFHTSAYEPALSLL